MGSGSRNGLLHSINVSGYFSPIKMFYFFLNTYEHWRCTTPCVKQSDTAHHSKNIWLLLFLLLPANLWGTTGSYIEGMMRNHTAGNLYLLTWYYYPLQSIFFQPKKTIHFLLTWKIFFVFDHPCWSSLKHFQIFFLREADIAAYRNHSAAFTMNLFIGRTVICSPLFSS